MSSQSYLDGTDPCAQAGVICQDDVAIITLNPIDIRHLRRHEHRMARCRRGRIWLHRGALTQVAQLGYPVALDGGLLMERNNSLGNVDGNRSNNTIIGSLMTGGSSGGPWVLNLGMPPSLSGTAFGQAAGHNLVAGVTSWGSSTTPTRCRGLLSSPVAMRYPLGGSMRRHPCCVSVGASTDVVAPVCSGGDVG